MSYLLPPFLYFSETNGQPLEDGYIYIGEAGEDAEINPISVYADDDLTDELEQPIRTTGGFPAYQGAATKLYIDGDTCSITVKNKRGVTVYTNVRGEVAGISRAELAANGGAALIGLLGPIEGEVPRTVNQVLGDIAVSIERFGAVGDWDGTSGTDNTSAIQAALDSGARHIFIPPKPYMVTDTLVPAHSQQIHGAGSGLLTYGATGLEHEQSLIALRGATGKTLFKIDGYITGGDNGHSFKGFTVNLDSVTNYAFQQHGGYGTVFEDITCFGTAGWWMVSDDSYVMEFNRVVMSGCEAKYGGILVGTYNHVSVKNFHTSMLPEDAATCMRGLAIYGGGRTVDVQSSLFQGPTIGIDVQAGQGIVLSNTYTENTVLPIKLGDTANAPIAVQISGSFSGPYADHPQYASRGPLVYIRQANAVSILPSRWESDPVDATNAHGPWPILCGGGAQNIDIAAQSIYLTNYERDIIVLENSSSFPAITMTSHYRVAGNYLARELLLKADKASGLNTSRHYGLRIDDSGTVTTSVWEPAVITGTVNSLLTGSVPNPSGLLL